MRTISAAPSRVAERLPDLVRIAAFAFAILAIELVLAAGLVNARAFQLMLLILAAAGAALLFRFPMASAMVMLALTDFIFYSGIVVLPLGPVEARPFELILGGLLVVALVRPRRHTWGGLAGGALAVFLGMVVLSGLHAYSEGRGDLTDIISWGRSFYLLTFFYVVVRLFPSREQRGTLMLGAAILAAVTGVVALLISLGWSVGDTLSGDSLGIVREQEGIEGVERVRLAGLSLGYGIFWYVATQIVFSQGTRRWGWGLLLAGIALDIIVSFNRNMWLGLFIGMLAAMVVGGAHLRGRLAMAIVLVVVGAGLISVVGGEGDDRLVDPVVERASTILSPGEVSQEGSYQDRRAETEVAWEAAKSNPLLGVGVGVPFGVTFYERVGPDTYAQTTQFFLHNQYLYLFLIGGIVGFAAFLTFLITPLSLAVRRSPRDPSVTAVGVGIAMIMMSAFVAIYFAAGHMTPVLALLAGYIVADHEADAEDAVDGF